MKTKLIILVLLATLSGCTQIKQTGSTTDGQVWPTPLPVSEREFVKLTLSEQDFQVELADTPQKIELGLSYRDEIGSEGLLFQMGRKGVPTFWMKGMKFGLDFLWLDCGSVVPEYQNLSCQVVDTTKAVPAPEKPLVESTLPTYSPIRPVTHVLEVNTGFIEAHQVETGTIISLNSWLTEDTP